MNSYLNYISNRAAAATTSNGVGMSIDNSSYNINNINHPNNRNGESSYNQVATDASNIVVCGV